jgi:uncharacterized protein YcbK (DUF882 family)|tara:strand:- start:922 stop:1332 length:411 start_codon:yes stop_codon:yes gene_type:complete
MIQAGHWREVPANIWPWQNFAPEEMADRLTGEIAISRDFMDWLQEMRDRFGGALPVNSGFRTPQHDRQLGGADVHPQGVAADINVAGSAAVKLVSLALRYPGRGVGIHQRGPWSKRFVHLDMINSPQHPRPRIWTY